MTSAPDIDPYAVLGVAKDATISEIRAAHRKRVLKCHPDKVQDESQRIAAQDEFQKVQQAYELLSDDVRRTKHDQKVKIAELLERRRTDSIANSPRGSGSATREFRNGHFMEERVPIEVYFEEKCRFTEEPPSMSSRKCDEYEYGVRSKTKPTEEKKKVRTPMSPHHQAKEQREAVKATHSDRKKVREQERRRQAEVKRDDTFGSFVGSDEDASDSSVPHYSYTRRTSTTPHRERDSRSRPSDSSRRRDRRYDEDDDVSDHWRSKIDSQYVNAEDYIASKAKGRSSKSPREYHGHDSAELESSASRSAERSTRTRRRSSSRDDSYEHLDSSRSYDVKPPKMQPSTTTPGIKASLRPLFLNTRSATVPGLVRPKLKRESREPTLHEMAHEPLPSRSSRMRDRTDSGYSSPSTPEMLQRGSSPKTSTRYKVYKEPDHIVVEPKLPKYRSARSPDRDRISPIRPTPKRSNTYQYTAEVSPRVETRSARPSVRSHPDVEYIARPKEKDIQYGRTYKEEDVSYSPRRAHYHYMQEEDYPPAVGRRQSQTAY
ncbi:uncharacterized protein N7479_006959 [Penicillium vulpinum]|uniref:J domain-containing protein n=1 Tax=Penicillium vulpinum TaxID=29845 RepID=A0A1V6S2G6_9EURO|nr:uncharacterized protein N7479_006959 [Penicillium vulpinum]KAJ5959809.1 hypothetical protein N7479_006959 [Penicillium vulpinum]OQE08241.1 hypothetical protein PENVUL_c010G01400 [Penicillium vulpinum]